MMNRYALISILALLAVITVLSFRVDSLSEERQRLYDNQESFFSDINHYRTKDSLSAASVGRLQLTANEYEKHFASQAELIESLNIKLKRVESVTQTGTSTEIPIKAQIKDSLVFRDSLILLPCINYHDLYFDFNGCIEQQHFIGKIAIRDTLTHVAHRIPKKFFRYRRLERTNKYKNATFVAWMQEIDLSA